jgi:TonB-linked SusC/RagA family outer membrane protein
MILPPLVLRTITSGARVPRPAVTPPIMESSTMKWAKVLLLLVAALVAPRAMQAQTGRITGTVTDSATGLPVQSATVLLVGTQTGAITTAEGRYLINNAPVGAQQVRVQRIGYAPRVQSAAVVEGQTATVNFLMPAQAARLTTVVSVGYGTQLARDVTGAVSTVTTEALQHTPIVSVDQLLQGTSPGVNVTTASNEPGGALSVRIRGTSSITGNPEPLYVIDGFPVESDAEGTSPGDGGRSRTTPTNPLVAINPSDIESISILKDASATAIYGSRGANGVVIITTRQGRGAKPTFTLDYSTGVSTVSKKYDLLNAAEYMDYANTFGQGSSTPFTPFPTTVPAGAPAGTKSVYQQILDSGIDTDWQDQIFRTGGVRNLQLSMRGASTAVNVTRYAISGGLFDQDGIVLGSGLKRLSGRVNVNQSIGPRFEVGGSLTGSQVRNKSTPTSGQQNAGAGAVSAALQYVPILPVYRANGTYSYINPDLNAYNTLLDAPPTPNPVSLAQEVTDSLSDNRLLANLYAQAQLLDNLTFRTTYGTDYAARGRNTYYNRNTVSGALAGGQAYVGSTTTNTWVNENTLSYQRAFRGVHDLSLLGGFTQQRTDFTGLNLSASDFPSDVTLYNALQAGASQGVPSSRRNSRTLESWLGRVNYSLLDRYLLTVNYRADGSSAFAESHKWAGFPSAAFAWRMSSEPFMKRFDAIDELKLRASYGVVGNPGIRPYQSLTRLTSQGYSFGGQYTSGYAVAAVGNPDLRWETTKGSDFGIDIGLLDRFAITADYYAKQTTDLLLQVSLPFETGYQTALANRGSVENKGFEVGVDAQVIKPTASGFSWHANLNFAKNRTRVLDLGTNPDGSPIQFIEADLLTTDYNLPGTRIVVGQPIGVFYGFKSLGVLQDAAQAAAVTYTPFSGTAFKAGQTLIADVDGNGKIDLNDRTIIGDPTPDFTAGLTNDLRYGRFQFTALLQGSHGGKILNVNRIRTESSPRANISRERVVNAWSPTNPTGTEPAIGENPNQVGPNNFTDNLLEDGSYLRLRSATLSFALPDRITSRTSMSDARLYLTGTNLITWTHYSGFDPDVSGQSVGTTNRGIDIGAYPLARGVTVGLNLNF